MFITKCLQVGVAAVLLDVWLFRARRRTPYRGGNATTMTEEFAAYGLPRWSCYLVGAAKVGAASMLLVGLWKRSVVLPAAVTVSVLMLGAVAMHLKIKDPLRKALPASTMLLLSLAIGARSLGRRRDGRDHSPTFDLTA